MYNFSSRGYHPKEQDEMELVIDQYFEMESAIQAAMEGDYQQLEEVMDNDLFKDFIINGREADGNTVLERALLASNTTLAEWLIQRGADVNLRGAGGVRAIDKITMSASDDVEGIQLLAKHGARLNGFCLPLERTPIMNCVFEKCPRKLKALLDAGADPNEYTGSHASAAGLALVWNQIKCFELLLEYGANPNGPDLYIPFYCSGSHLARCMHLFKGSKCDDVMLTILSYGADIDYETDSGTPFLDAIEAENSFWAEYFIEKGCKIYFHNRSVGPMLGPGNNVAYDYHRFIDMVENEDERDVLNTLLFGSGELVEIDVNRLKQPHSIVEMLEHEKSEFCLMSLCRKFIRDYLRQNRTNLIYQTQRLVQLPEVLRKYLVYK